MNSFKFSRERLKNRKNLLISSLESVISDTSDFIHNEYNSFEKLSNAELFCKSELMEVPTACVDHINKVGFFPWIEAARELDSSMTVIFEGNYKNGYDSLRRALELVITGSFFVLDHIDSEKAVGWIKSDKSTPNFKRAVELLGKRASFQVCNKDSSWEKAILDHYWELCDVIHVKGVDNSFNSIAPRFSFVSGIAIPCFESKSCSKILDSYIKTVELIALTLALNNPVLLVGFDIDRKFGFNPPVSGYLYPDQSERLNNLIPEMFKMNIKELIEYDKNILSIKNWFESIPDITEEELKKQAKQQDGLFNQVT